MSQIWSEHGWCSYISVEITGQSRQLLASVFALMDNASIRLVVRVADTKQNNHIHYSGLKCLEAVVACYK